MMISTRQCLCPPEGFYEWKVIPFGLANTPAPFMRRMNQLLNSHPKYAIVYLDDILIFSKSETDHIRHVEAVLESIRLAKFKLNGPKYTFGQTRYGICGYRVTRHGVDTESKKIEAIISWPAPTTAGQLRLFLGLAGYYRKFVEGFAYRSSKLHDLVNSCVGKTRTAFSWALDHRKQFDDLNRALYTAPVLGTLDPRWDFILRTDASDVAIGAVLSQRQEWKGKLVGTSFGF
jgi:hypothetical protein